MTSHPQNYNYKRDNRRTQTADIYKPKGNDACQTPPYALDPLLPFLRPGWNIWEPAAGEGIIVKTLKTKGYTVTPSDILTGQNFFDYEPDQWDCIVTNPPFSIKFRWLKRCYQLGKPFALLVPVEMLGTREALEMFEKFGLEWMLLKRRVDFKMPNKGWASTATFPTFWITHKLTGQQVTIAEIRKRAPDQLELFSL